MFGHIVVGVDESGGGRDAIALARKLVAPDGKLILAHVVTIAPREGIAASIQPVALPATCRTAGRRAGQCLLSLRRGACSQNARMWLSAFGLGVLRFSNWWPVSGTPQRGVW